MAQFSEKSNNVDVLSSHSTRALAYSESLLKRGLDILCASILLALSLPVLVPMLLLNAVLTKGHPLFVQKRAGKGGVEFRLLKLRTMRIPLRGESWSHRTNQNDERVTRFGRLLRISYVDELPQLLNVLAGQMSLIGPRPETLETTNEIAAQQPRFTERMRVRPGISGTAQVFFRKPESDNDLWLRYYYDHHYLAHASFKLDLALMFLTVWHVVRYKGH